MKRIYFSMLLSALICAGCKPSAAPAIAVDRDIEAKVANTLKRMTLDEKVGQMCELTIEVLADESSTPENFVMSEQALKTVIGEYKVGSILNVPMDRAVTKEKWTEVITRIQEASMEYIGIPDVYGVDQNHGASYTVGATFFPQELNQGATFNRDLVAKANEISAYESRACNIPWLYNPVLDQARDPRWPRFWENYGESEFLNAAMGVVAVKALQGDDPNHIDRNHVAVSLKHYLGY
ncbi:MAG: beta-glucosidase, partial [Bacteroidales bacterium]|nr:beta-glucosidase [Bacteroidales bacterium]